MNSTQQSIQITNSRIDELSLKLATAYNAGNDALADHIAALIDSAEKELAFLTRLAKRAA